MISGAPVSGIAISADAAAAASNTAVNPGAAALLLAGAAPAIAQSGAQFLSPGNAALALASPAPSLAQTANQGVSLGASALLLQGYAPGLAQSINQAANPGAGAYALAGYAPGIAQAGSSALFPPTGALTLVNSGPVVAQSGQPNPSMTIVVWDPNQDAQFKLEFPEFAGIPYGRTLGQFNIAQCTLLDNTANSPVMDLCYRTHLFYLLVAHMLLLFGATTSATGGLAAPNNTPPGRLDSATEGTISSSFDYQLPAGSASAPWYAQTKYGAMYWTATVQFRSAQYFVSGSSGIGFAKSYVSAPVVRPGGV